MKRLSLPFLMLSAVVARAGDPVEFKVAHGKGDMAVITESEKIEGKIKYEDVKGKSKVDFGKRKTDFLSLKRWQYDEECTEVNGEMSKRTRDFAVATKEELEEDGKDHKKTQFPHHGRKATIAQSKIGLAVYIEGEQYEEGLAEQGWIDVLPTMLPAEPVAMGKEFEIDGVAVMKSWSKGMFGDKGTTGSGKGKYAEDVKVGKLKCAKIWVSVQMKGEAGKDLPAIDMNVSGYIYFALEQKLIVKAELTGPVIFKMRAKDNDIGAADVTVTATLKETFEAEVFAAKK